MVLGVIAHLECLLRVCEATVRTVIVHGCMKKYPDFITVSLLSTHGGVQQAQLTLGYLLVSELSRKWVVVCVSWYTG